MIVEKLIDPILLARIVQEFRSHIAVKTVNACNFKELNITDIEYEALGTKYYFEIDYEVLVPGVATSSVLDLEGVRPQAPRIDKYEYAGFLREYVELDEPDKNRFEVMFVKKGGQAVTEY
uniref:Uncharacterized protein n=1 Tax=Serratia phage Kevin TaxID=3161161 RepID=A0AAU8KZ78_9CAUD